VPARPHPLSRRGCRRAVEREVTGFHAGVVEHEYDHLDGILYPMRMKDFSLFGFNEELARVAAARQEGR
jgi:peptide deformylase